MNCTAAARPPERPVPLHDTRPHPGCVVERVDSQCGFRALNRLCGAHSHAKGVHPKLLVTDAGAVCGIHPKPAPAGNPPRGRRVLWGRAGRCCMRLGGAACGGQQQTLAPSLPRKHGSSAGRRSGAAPSHASGDNPEPLSTCTTNAWVSTAAASCSPRPRHVGRRVAGQLGFQAV